jgi:hypothetical protein
MKSRISAGLLGAVIAVVVMCLIPQLMPLEAMPLASSNTKLSLLPQRSSSNKNSIDLEPKVGKLGRALPRSSFSPSDPGATEPHAFGRSRIESQGRRPTQAVERTDTANSAVQQQNVPGFCWRGKNVPGSWRMQSR